MKGAGEAAGTASGLTSGLAGVLGIGLVVGLTAAAAGFIDLDKAMSGIHAKYSQIDADFQKWITNMVNTAASAKDVAEAEDKIKKALESNAITKEQSAKLMQLLDDRQKQVVGIDWNKYKSETGLAFDFTGLKIGENTKQLDGNKKSHEDILGALEAGKQKWVEYGGEIMKATRNLVDVDPIIKMLVDDMAAAEQISRDWTTAVANASRELGHLASVSETIQFLDDATLAKFTALVDGFKDFSGEALKNLNADLKDTANSIRDLTAIPLTPTQEAMKALGLNLLDVKNNSAAAVEHFRNFAADSGNSLAGVEAAWNKVRGAVRDLAATDLPAAMAAYNDYISRLEAGGASQGQIYEVQRQGIQTIITELRNAGQSTADWEIKLNDLNRAMADLGNNNGVWGEIRVELDRTKETMSQLTTVLAQDLAGAFDGMFDKLSSSLASALVDGKSFSDAMIGYFKDVARTILEDVINIGLNSLKNALTDLATNALKSLGSGLAGIFSGSGGLLSEIGNVNEGFKNIMNENLKNAGDALGKLGISATGAANPIAGAGEASKGLSSGLSGATSSLTGWIGAIGAAAGAVGSFIQVFQGAKQETTLNAIEKNTRETAMHVIAFINDRLYDTLNHIGDGVWYMLEHTVNQKNAIEDMNATIHDLRDNLGAKFTDLGLSVSTAIKEGAAEVTNLLGWILAGVNIVAEAQWADRVVNAVQSLSSQLGSIEGAVRSMGDTVLNGLSNLANIIASMPPPQINVNVQVAADGSSSTQQTSSQPQGSGQAPYNPSNPYNYNVPTFALGGIMQEDGMAMLHAGEMVLPPDVSDMMRALASSASVPDMSLARMPSVPGAMSLPEPGGGFAAASSGQTITIGTIALPGVHDVRGFVREMQRMYGRLTPKAQPVSA